MSIETFNDQSDISREVLEQAEIVRDALVRLPVIRPLRPERYWSGDIRIIENTNIDETPDVPIEADFRKREGSLQVTYYAGGFENEVAEICDESPIAKKDLLALYIGHAMMSVLSIRALRPRKISEFIEHISMPNGLFSDVIISGLIDESSPYKIMNEFFIGNEDRIPKVNVARFATGAVYMAMEEVRPGFREEMTGLFRMQLSAELAHGDPYRKTAQDLLETSHDKSQEMFAEHIKWFNLAAAFPKHPEEVEDFVSVYRS